jgi:hypothetical protein
VIDRPAWLAPRVLRAIYVDELKRLDAYAREHHPA